MRSAACFGRIAMPQGAWQSARHPGSLGLGFVNRTSRAADPADWWHPQFTRSTEI